MKTKISALVLACACFLASSVSAQQPATTPEFTGALGIEWNMPIEEASLKLGMKQVRTEPHAIYLHNTTRAVHGADIDSVWLYHDTLGVSFVRIDYHTNDYAKLIAHYTSLYGAPKESDKIVTRWIDPTGRYFNLFGPQGKRNGRNDHVIAIFNRDIPVIGDMMGKR
jgi:hypothetical protein